MRRHFIVLIGVLASAICCVAQPAGLPSLDEALHAKTDVWGEAAMRQTNGPSYEFFRDLLPPPRYVNADFHYYPIVLSAPNARVKGRLISNGAGINLPGGARSWDDVGTPVIFRVGPDEFKFGDIANRLEQPQLADGCLPIVTIRYAHATEIYELEAFASTDPMLASNGVIFVKFSIVGGSNNWICAQVQGEGALHFNQRSIQDAGGRVLAVCDEHWQWERQLARTRISTNSSATLAIATKPLAGTNLLTAVRYDEERARCVAAWNKVLAGAMRVEVPEPLVNNAWRALLLQDFTIIEGDKMNYGAGNQYQKMYAAESSDAALPMMKWGYDDDMRRLLPAILDVRDKRLPHHFAAHKLDALCELYWQTRDAAFVRAMRPRWQPQLDLILTDRSPENGLMNKDNYCTDIEVPVYSLNANAPCWAALRDIAPVLDDLGDKDLAARVRKSAASLKQAILDAVAKNERHETYPPFIPMALFYNEPLHDPIAEDRLGSYWNLVANYVIGSRIFAGTGRELSLSRYMEQHGGLCMGLTRSAAANHTFWTGKERTNPLYGMRYNLDCLRRDDVERALVGFYGELAHGMTRNTFVGAEGCSVQPLDQGGRFFYCPPNTSNNGQWLATFRDLLVQDWDTDEDGRPDTLRLCFATPRRWLEDGKVINVENAPTAFGRAAVRLESQLKNGRVLASVDLPRRNPPARIFLRARVPEGWRVTGAQIGAEQLPVDDKGTVELSGREGNCRIIFAARLNNARP
jgi:hypothetical protein